MKQCIVRYFAGQLKFFLHGLNLNRLSYQAFFIQKFTPLVSDEYKQELSSIHLKSFIEQNVFYLQCFSSNRKWRRCYYEELFLFMHRWFLNFIWRFLSINKVQEFGWCVYSLETLGIFNFDEFGEKENNSHCFLNHRSATVKTWLSDVDLLPSDWRSSGSFQRCNTFPDFSSNSFTSQ